MVRVKARLPASGFKQLEGIDVFCVGEEELGVVDSGATFHVTGNPMLMFDWKPPPVGKSTLVVRDNRSLQGGYFGKLSMVMHRIGDHVHDSLGKLSTVMHSIGGHVHVTSVNTAYISAWSPFQPVLAARSDAECTSTPVSLPGYTCCMAFCFSLKTSQARLHSGASWHASDQRRHVGGSGTPSKKTGSLLALDAIASSSITAIRRSTTPSCSVVRRCGSVRRPATVAGNRHASVLDTRVLHRVGRG